MPGATSTSSLAAANPRQASPCGSCSTTLRSFTHCWRPYLTFSARVGAANAATAAAEAESVELDGRRLDGFEDRSGDEPDRSHPSLRVGAVVDAEAGVNEHQAVVGFDQQHVAYALRTANGVHGAAVEMVDLHRFARPRPLSSMLQL